VYSRAFLKLSSTELNTAIPLSPVSFLVPLPVPAPNLLADRSTDTKKVVSIVLLITTSPRAATQSVSAGEQRSRKAAILVAAVALAIHFKHGEIRVKANSKKI
jgi:hypothetical protein